MSNENNTESASRIALLGLHLEASSFAPPTQREDFENQCWAEGEVISVLARKISHLPSELPGFYARMDATGPWTAVPIIVISAMPGGPIMQDVFQDFLDQVQRRLLAALPVDGVYVASHGASSATGDLDSDGTLLALIRDIVGPTVPVVVTHDLHCNVSERLVQSADALIAYRTNPHVDQRERAAEAADLMRRMLVGLKTKKAFIRMPIAAPTVSLLTEQGPYADLIKLGQELTRPPILNVSVTGGFVLGDLPKCGMTINVTADNDQAAADTVARQIARAAWADRDRYFRKLTSLDEAVDLARRAGSGNSLPIILADVADNPGGGGRGNTVWLLEAIHAAKVAGAVVGMFTDSSLVKDALRVGEGAHFEAVFNRTEGEFSKRFVCGATVEKITDGIAVGRRGILAGRQFSLGPTALLRLDGSGLRVAVASLRQQMADPRMLEMFGIDIAQIKCLVVKSRGHFRAGFDEFYKPEQIYEVDTLGLTSPVLANFTWKHMKRPMWPLDAETTWNEY